MSFTTTTTAAPSTWIARTAYAGNVARGYVMLGTAPGTYTPDEDLAVTGPTRKAVTDALVALGWTPGVNCHVELV